MKNLWIVEEQGFHKEGIADNGNRFLIGNGYMGIRGTLDEFTKEQLVAINLAGIYDKVGDGWREPLNAPNPIYTVLHVDGEKYGVLEKEAIEHTVTLNFREAVLCRKTVFQTQKGNVTFQATRFLNMENPHLIHAQYEVICDFDADVEFRTGIDIDVWDIYGPHFEKYECGQEQIFSVKASIQEEREQVWVLEKTQGAGNETVLKENDKLLRVFSYRAVKGETAVFTKQCAIYTSKDKELAAGNLTINIDDLFAKDMEAAYEKEKAEHIAWWEEKWNTSQVVIDGDDEAMCALNYSLYHLHSIAPRHSDSLSIAARGLSGQTYKGAVFWDTEMFILDFFLYTEPSVAKTLLKYRIDTLDGARQKAKDYGYQGAFYAWESQEGGFDACSDYNVTDVFTGRPMRTYFKDKQIHISAAIVSGIMRYVEHTKDYSVLEEGGIETIVECARFYYSLLIKKVNGAVYELHDVIGPDEYHERVNNNGYTNRMAKYSFEKAYELLSNVEKFSESTQKKLAEKFDVSALKEEFKDAAENIYIPAPNEEGVIEQFDGYLGLEDVSVEEVRKRLLHEKEYWGGAYGVASHTQIIKQADVVTWLTLFANEFSKEVLAKNWEYYEPRTEHGSSLSACMYAWLACINGYPEKAYPFFLKSAMADLKGGGKQWAGLVYIGGTHPAASGGAYMNAIHGFAGVSFEDGKIKVNPVLPPNWKSMKFTVSYQSKQYAIEINGKKSTVTEL
ncbi:MAG: glycoside hydrolase family 65 protein [Lachnospiraceae bacterium]|nr:glycoside hydrolase family 65 protein [Lachnospiraceae bacterium]